MSLGPPLRRTNGKTEQPEWVPHVKGIERNTRTGQLRTVIPPPATPETPAASGMDAWRKVFGSSPSLPTKWPTLGPEAK